MNYNIKKNMLDLQFQNYLIIASTTTGIMFAYIIAIAIGFVTRQITLDVFSIIFLVITTSVILLPGAFICKKAIKQLQDIPLLIEDLK